MATSADMVPAVFDAELLAVVQDLIPPKRLHAYLRDLDRQFSAVVGSTSGDATLQDRAHKIVSQAGMFGLTRMSECARQVEDACRAGSGQEAAVLHCSEAIADIRLYAMPAAGSLGCGEPPSAI